MAAGTAPGASASPVSPPIPPQTSSLRPIPLATAGRQLIWHRLTCVPPPARCDQLCARVTRLCRRDARQLGCRPAGLRVPAREADGRRRLGRDVHGAHRASFPIPGLVPKGREGSELTLRTPSRRGRFSRASSASTASIRARRSSRPPGRSSASSRPATRARARSSGPSSSSWTASSTYVGCPPYSPRRPPPSS
jgi:hypothetical protein